jgi:CHAT domain-containing protein
MIGRLQTAHQSYPAAGMSLLLSLLCCCSPGHAADSPPAVAAVPTAAATISATGFDPERYEPAVLRLTVTQDPQGRDSILDLTLIPSRSELIGKRVTVPTQELGDLLRDLYGRLARQQAMDVANPSSPSRRLHQLLLEPLSADMQQLAITTLLISADPGLQAVPFAALHDGTTYAGERFAMAITPSLGLMPLDVPDSNADSRRKLAVGASEFDGLAPLPLVPQELERVTPDSGDERYVNRSFTPDVLVQKAGEESFDRVHVATHAEFLPGGPGQARLYTGTGPMSLRDFANLRQRRAGSAPLELLALSACRTALGDKDSELGFAGLALQAGARSAIGTLWYVDDVATSAFFVQFYRYLEEGLPKAEALQATRRAMASGLIRLKDNQMLGVGDRPLLSGLTANQQRRISSGLEHPFYWAGITLMGTPW